MKIENSKSLSSGELEIVGEEGDYFGKLILNGKRKRMFEVGLAYRTEDSLSFILPGNGGYLRLKKRDALWKGSFKYFGITADLTANRIAEPSKDLMALVTLKPIGRGIISTFKEESFPSYDNKNQILYFTRDQDILSSKFDNGKWSTPNILDINADFTNNAPSISADGNTLLFTSNHPLDSSSFKKKNIWSAKYKEGKWSKPRPFPYPINIDSLGDYHQSISAMGNIYFVSYNRTNGFGRSDIYKASKTSVDSYEVNNLGDSINTDLSEADVFIDSQERYLIFASTGRDDSYGADDIYISHNTNGRWTKPINLGPKVNSFAYEYGAWVDHKNGYLYFNSYRRGTSDIYRIKLSELELFN
ncbi:hypothetical protein [Winogradskyella poriferorum]|uniref:hypothetical protein n=1 Tax=Winogradskyella poriferorum TaxID=307627 RepID=UPI003D64885A